MIHLCLLDAYTCCLDIFTTIFEGLFELHPKVLYNCHKIDIVGVLTVRKSFCTVECRKILNQILHLCLFDA